MFYRSRRGRCSLLFAVLAGMPLVLGAHVSHASPADLAQMVQAEYDFSDLAKREGYKASFLKYLAPDNVMFASGPIAGRKHVSERPDLPGLLQWYPEYAVVSSAGDLGLSMGPWVYTNPQGKPSGYGHFFSIWKRQADGQWLNVLDVGIDHGEMQPAPTKLKVPASSTHAAPSGMGTSGTHASPSQPKHRDTTSEVRAAEARFAQLAASTSYARAVERTAHPDVRVFRDGQPPVAGAVPAVAFLADLGPVGAPRPDFATGSGDFGYAYGTIGRSQGQGASHSFVHVWKQQNGNWLLLAELLKPVVDPQAQ